MASRAPGRQTCKEILVHNNRARLVSTLACCSDGPGIAKVDPAFPCRRRQSLEDMVKLTQIEGGHTQILYVPLILEGCPLGKYRGCAQRRRAVDRQRHFDELIIRAGDLVQLWHVN